MQHKIISENTTIEEYYNTIKSFFEKYGMKNDIPCSTLSKLFCCDIILYDTWNEESEGYLFFENENSIRIYSNKDKYGALYVFIEFKNIISITNGMDLNGRETLNIRYFYNNKGCQQDFKIYKK